MREGRKTCAGGRRKEGKRGERSDQRRGVWSERGRFRGTRNMDDGTRKVRRNSRRRVEEEEEREEEGEEEVVHVLCPILHGERTLSSAASGRAKTGLVS